MLHERVVHGLTVTPHGYPCSDEPPVQDPAAASVGGSSANPAVPRRADQAADSQHAARPHPVPACLPAGALLRLHPPAAPHAAGHPERNAGQFGGKGGEWGIMLRQNYVCRDEDVCHNKHYFVVFWWMGFILRWPNVADRMLKPISDVSCVVQVEAVVLVGGWGGGVVRVNRFHPKVT